MSPPRAVALRDSGAVSVAWLLAVTVFLRWFDLTIRVDWLPLWTLAFTGLYAAQLGLLGAGPPSVDAGPKEGAAADPLEGGSPGRPATPSPWSDVWLWLGLAVSGGGVTLIFPTLSVGSVTLQSVALVRLLEMVVPLWIVFRGASAPWPGVRRWGIAAVFVAYILLDVWFVTVRMPGESHTGPLPPPTREETEIQGRLREHVAHLADSIGARGRSSPERVARTAAYLEERLRALGHTPERREFVVDGRSYVNLQATIPGSERPDEIVIVGAHYDTYDLTPGADDNASGAAGVLELARLLAGTRPERTLRLVFFANEEPPFFGTETMGSRVYAARAAEAGEDIVAMFSLETIGYFSDAPGSQRYPPPFDLFYPDRGDFVGFIGNPDSGRLLRRAVATFRLTTPMPSEGAAVSSMTPGAELSDHASFWRHGYPALMITDTAPFRNDNYHTSGDTPDTLDFERMARVVAGVRRVVAAEAWGS